MLPNLQNIQAAADIVSRSLPKTPQYRWPLLCEKIGRDLWLKHENHTPVGAFKVRGGLVYFAHHFERLQQLPGVICATRGNHGQSIAFAAGQYDIPVTIVVPHGNSREKNAAMQSLGATLIEHGDDFQAALEYAQQLAEQQNLAMIPSFDSLLVAGVATYSLELLQAVPDIDVLYVPIGLGSGICGAIAARNALGLPTEIVGVVSSHARAYAESFTAQTLVERPADTEIADGMACRKPVPQALEIICDQVARIVEVSDDDVAQAMRDLFTTTHNVAEGAGAAGVAAATKDAPQTAGKRIATVVCGGNVDADVFASVLTNTRSH